ncbi:hypothetical protein ACFVQ4_33025 [Streptomyces laurentii]|uniref:hypothetical protein n=1 Tax=Streptomyces laurentii TaxID=39478 RepID=UPI0036A9EB3C
MALIEAGLLRLRLEPTGRGSREEQQTDAAGRHRTHRARLEAGATPVVGPERGLRQGRSWLGIALRGELFAGVCFVSERGPQVPQRDHREEAAEPGHGPQCLGDLGQELGRRPRLIVAWILEQTFHDFVQ